MYWRVGGNTRTFVVIVVFTLCIEYAKDIAMVLSASCAALNARPQTRAVRSAPPPPSWSTSGPGPASRPELGVQGRERGWVPDQSGVGELPLSSTCTPVPGLAADTGSLCSSSDRPSFSPVCNKTQTKCYKSGGLLPCHLDPAVAVEVVGAGELAAHRHPAAGALQPVAAPVQHLHSTV